MKKWHLEIIDDVTGKTKYVSDDVMSLKEAIKPIQDKWPTYLYNRQYRLVFAS